MDDRVMEISPEWSSQSVRQFFDLSGPHADIMKAANLPPSMVIIQRINLGLFALFGELERARQLAADGRGAAGRSCRDRRPRRWARRSPAGPGRADSRTGPGYSTRRIGLPRIAADQVVVSLTPLGNAARTLIQQPVPIVSLHV